MKYQLVLQWPTSLFRGFRLLIALEEAVIAGIGDFGDVDDHDMGSDEMNMVVFTEQPERAFERVKSIPKVDRNMRKVRVGYRAVGEDVYTPIYTLGLIHFSIM